MALSKAITTDTGASAKYWRMTGRYDDYVNRRISFTVAGFSTAEASNHGKTALIAQQFTLDLEKDQTHEQVGRAELYAHARTHELFENAEDN